MPLERHAIFPPLFVVVAMQRHVVRFIGYSKVGEDATLRRKFWEYLVPDAFADGMCVIDIDFYSGCVVSHLTDLALANNIETLDNLESRLPVPDICSELEILRAEIVQCKAHKLNVRQTLVCRKV